MPTPGDAFGRGVAVDQGQILVTSHGYDQPFANAGAIFVFEHDSEWVQVQRFNVEGAAASYGLGTTFAARDGTIITGNPNAASQGIAHFFGRTPFGWIYSQTFTPLGVGGVKFGSSVSVRNGKALVGGPNERFWAAYGGDHAGAAYFYTKQNHAWKLSRRLNLYWPNNQFSYGPYECWAGGPQPPGWYNQSAAFLGSAVAVSDSGLIAASDLLISVCWNSQVTQNQRVINVFPFDIAVQDCNANSIPDHCAEFDCNGNDVPDDCDLFGLSSLDCNLNSTPDECDAGFRYALDNETPSIAWYASPSAGYADFIWLNQYRVKPGGQFITHIALAKTPYIPPNAPVTVLLYGDPNNDGDPSDAVLLTTAETRAMILDLNLLTEWAYVPIPLTYVGQPGDHFFVGAVVRPPYLGWDSYLKWSVPLSASGPTQMGRSWRAMAPPGEADIYDLTNNASPITLQFAKSHVWSVHDSGRWCRLQRQRRVGSMRHPK